MSQTQNEARVTSNLKLRDISSMHWELSSFGEREQVVQILGNQTVAFHSIQQVQSKALSKADQRTPHYHLTSWQEELQIELEQEECCPTDRAILISLAYPNCLTHFRES